MRLIIGEYAEGRLQPGFNEAGEDVPAAQLQELKGRFSKEFRDANIKFTEQQLLASATPDQDLIQAVHALENIETVINSMGKYTTEWYELHHPNETAAWDQLAARDLSEPGLHELNAALQALVRTRDELIAHIERQCAAVLPNTTHVAGAVIAAKLLASAGGLERLAGFPSTTVQLLGAERALFRHLRGHASPPKYGILFNHVLVQRVRPPKRGKMARLVANAISIACKVDYHHGEPIGEQQRTKLEVQADALARS